MRAKCTMPRSVPRRWRVDCCRDITELFVSRYYSTFRLVVKVHMALERFVPGPTSRVWYDSGVGHEVRLSCTPRHCYVRSNRLGGERFELRWAIPL